MDRKHIPCYLCLRRSQICHAQCKEYHDWVEVRKKEREAMSREADANAYAQENYNRWKWSKGRFRDNGKGVMK